MLLKNWNEDNFFNRTYRYTQADRNYEDKTTKRYTDYYSFMHAYGCQWEKKCKIIHVLHIDKYIIILSFLKIIIRKVTHIY